MAFRNGPFWIDSEGRMRDDNDRLDVKKTGRHLSTCDGIMNHPEFEDVLMAAQQKRIERELARK